MKTNPLTSIITVAFMCSMLSSTWADDFAEAIRDFRFQGMPFGTTLTEFKQKLPNATIDVKHSDPKQKLVAYTLHNVSGVDYVNVKFLIKKCFWLHIGISHQQSIRSEGGRQLKIV